MDRERRDLVFGRYAGIYEDLFRYIYPSRGSTGFGERNLSVNFSKACESAAAEAGERALSWFEFQFGSRSTLHVDAVILNTGDGDGELLLVESKRFSNPGKKIREIAEDVDRIHRLAAELRAENESGTFRVDLSRFRRCYGVILADAWPEGPKKTAIIDSFRAGVRDPASPDSFLNRYCREALGDRQLPELAYDLRELMKWWSHPYYLTSFLWRVF